MEEKIYLVLLHTIGLTQKQLTHIFGENNNGKIGEKNYYKKYKDFYNDFSRKLLEFYGLKSDKISFLLENYHKYTKSFIENTLKKRDVRLIVRGEVDYPGELECIGNPPFLLYLRGEIPMRPKISLVGSRKMTDYGKQVITHLVPNLGRYFDIVSGGAYGCDTTAHLVALDNNIITMSIIGTGIDQDYPVGNQKLYDRIVASGGAVVSMFAIGELGKPYNFPIRNELVAAWSLGVLVIEAKKRSGTLITSQLALDLGKELFSIPGEIYKHESEGCNYLIQSGQAKLVTQGSDIFEEFNIYETLSAPKEKKVFADKIEESIYHLLLTSHASVDEIMKVLELDVKTISLKLSYLELSGIITKGNGGKYFISG